MSDVVFALASHGARERRGEYSSGLRSACGTTAGKQLVTRPNVPFGTGREHLAWQNEASLLADHTNCIYDSRHVASIAQLVRASGCGPEGQGFKSLYSPQPSRSEGCPK